MGQMQSSVFALATAIVGVAIIAVIVSKNSATVDVIKASAGAFNDALKTAISPISVK